MAKKATYKLFNGTAFEDIYFKTSVDQVEGLEERLSNVITTPTWTQVSGKPTWIGDSEPTYDLSEIAETTTYKRVTATEKSTWGNKQNLITGAATTITSNNLTANRALISNGSSKVAVSAVTSTQLGYLSDVTSNIQAQLGGKAATGHSHFAATKSTAGFLSAADKTKLDGIDAGAQVNVGTNLSQGARGTTTLRIDSSTGNNLTLPAVTTSLAGLMTSTDKTRLDVLHSLLEEDTSNNVVDSINEVLEVFNNYPEGVDLVTALSGKVDKVSGKGLSTNDFTTTEKNKLSGIATGAQKNSAITKAEIEAKLTGTITSHTHNYRPAGNVPWEEVSGKPTAITGAMIASATNNEVGNKLGIVSPWEIKQGIESLTPSIPSVMGTTEGNAGTARTQRTISAKNLKDIILNHSPAGSRPASDVSSWAKKSSLVIGDIPTGTTGTTVALGNHTHSQYLFTTGKAADSNKLNGLELNNTTTNNEANKVMRTDGSGYANFGWIKTTSGNTTSAVSDVYVNTGDGWIYKKTLPLFKEELGSMPASDVSAWAKTGNSDTIPTSKLPALAITDTFEVATQSAMTSLTAQKGDIAIRTDLNKTFILSAEPASTLGNWKELRTPTDAVLSVAGLTGAITSSNLKTSLSLNNVENKSSATIRSEITSANVTSALGFTPYNSTNPNGYATTSYVNGKTYLKSNTDNRSVNTAPNDYNAKFDIKGLKSNSTLGITGQGSYSALLGIRGWTDSSGGNSHEFALTGDGEIYHRHGATTTWNAWNVLAKQSWVTANTRSNTWTPAAADIPPLDASKISTGTVRKEQLPGDITYDLATALRRLPNI